MYIYLATGLTQSDAHPDADEFLDVERRPLDEMVRRVYLGRNFELRTSPQMKRKQREEEEREREEALRALGHIPQQNDESDEEDDE